MCTPREFFRAVIQTILLFGLWKWVVTPHIGRTLGGFHNRESRWLTVMQTWRWNDRSWIHPPLREAPEAAEMGLLEDYIARCQNMVAQYNGMHMILEICIGTERMEGSQAPIQWW